MVFLAGVAFADTKLVKKTLTSFFGIGPQICKQLMAKFYIHNEARLGDLSERTVTELAEGMSKMTLENELRRRILGDIERLRDMKSYRGSRHVFGFPVRGQNTKSGGISTARKLNRVNRHLGSSQM